MNKEIKKMIIEKIYREKLNLEQTIDLVEKVLDEKENQRIIDEVNESLCDNSGFEEEGK